MASLNFKETGSGFPLVLLHGFCETHEIWDGIAHSLADGFRVLTPDLPGFGKSPLKKEQFTLSDIAGELDQWLDGMRVDTCIMIGHSLGGYITLSMADAFPEKLLGLGLFNSSAYADSPEKRENRDKLIDFITKEGVAPFIQTFIPSLFYSERAEQFSQTIRRLKELGTETAPETVIGYAAAMKRRPDHTTLLRTYKDRILLIAGEHDQNVPLEQSREMAGMINPEHAYILPDTAHMGMFEQPEKSTEAIRKFAGHLL